MAKTVEQFKSIEQISRQTRHRGAYLNQLYNQQLSTRLNQLDSQCDEIIERSISRQELEEERKRVLCSTVEQIIKERQQKQLLPKLPIRIKQEIIAIENLNPTFLPLKIPSVEIPCQLFSHQCQLYPCQPVYHYTSFMRKDHDQTLRNRHGPEKTSPKPVNIPRTRDIFTIIEQEQHRPDRRQLASAIRNQRRQVNRHISMQRKTMKFDEQSRLLHERLYDKRTFGYNKSRQRKLTRDIYRYLHTTAKFCE